MNLLSYIKNKGLARGGVKYVDLQWSTYSNILQGKKIKFYGTDSSLIKAIKDKFESYGGDLFLDNNNKELVYVVLCTGEADKIEGSENSCFIDRQNKHFRDLYFHCQDIFKDMKRTGRGNIIFVFAECLYDEMKECSILGNVYRNFFEGIAKEGFEEIRSNAILVKPQKINSYADEYVDGISELICFLASDRAACISGNSIIC